MIATLIKKIRHSVLCLTGVYFRNITNTIFVIFHLNVNCLRVCSTCLENTKNKGQILGIDTFVLATDERLCYIDNENMETVDEEKNWAFPT